MSYLCRGKSYGWPLGLVCTMAALARRGELVTHNANNMPDYIFYRRVFYLIHGLVFLNALIQNKNHIHTITSKTHNNNF